MNTLTQTPLREIMATRAGTVDPALYPNETFDLYSIPAFDKGKPDVLLGQEIGSTKQVVQPGDVLLSKIVPHIRRSWVVGNARGRRLIASSEWIVFRSDRFHSPYLRHVLTSDPFHVQFMGTVAGVGGSLLRARPAQVASLTIPLPPLPEQRRIANILDKADAVRRKRQEAVVELVNLLDSTFWNMFCPYLTFPSDQLTSSLGEEVRFIDYRGRSPNKVECGIPLVTARHIKRGYFSFDPPEFIPESEYESWMCRGFPAEGDVLFTTEGHTLGSAARLPKFKKVALAQRLIALQCKERLRSDYLLQLVLTDRFQEEVLKRATGSAARGIRAEELRKIPIPVPPIELQKRFSDCCEVIRHQNELVLTAVLDSVALFNSLVQRAFRGEL
jgi:type I restriction enzyme S subunit